MSWTFQTIQARVQSYVLELPQATLDDIPNLVNEAITEAEDEHNFRVMKASTEFVTAEGLHELGTLTGFKELRGKPWLRFNDGGNENITTASDENELVRIFDINSSLDKSRPRVVFLASVDEDGDDAADFEVYPFPDGNSDWDDGEYRINIPYWRYLPDLVADVDTNWFLNRMPLYVLNKAVARAHAVNFDEQRSVLWEQRATNELRRGIKVDKLSRLQRNHVLEPRRDVHGHKFQGRM